MATERETYNTRRGTIDKMRDIITIYAPVVTRTSNGGQRTQWVEWRTPFAAVENLRGNEEVLGDRKTAVNSKRFTLRTGSIPDVNETMMLVYDAQQYMIERIDHAEDLPHKMYRIITAIRRATNVQPVEFLGNGMYMDFAQNLTNQTGSYVTVTAGTLLDTSERTAEQVHLLLDVIVSQQLRTYNQAGDGGFTIDNDTNRINFNFPLAGENVLVRQYQAT